MYVEETLEAQIENMRKMQREHMQNMLPTLQKILDSGLADLKTTDERWKWQQDAEEKIIKATFPLPAFMMGDYFSMTPRTHCPLCGDGVIPNYGVHLQGFAYPDGLRWHLEGSHNMRQCPDVRAANQQSWNRLDSYLENETPKTKKVAARKRAPKKVAKATAVAK
jgi:hypothetical protein